MKKNLGFIVSIILLALLYIYFVLASNNIDAPKTKVSNQKLTDLCKMHKDSLENILKNSGSIRGKLKSYKFKKPFPVITDVNEIKLTLSTHKNKLLRDCLNQCGTKEMNGEIESYTIPIESYNINDQEYLELPCCLIVELTSRN